jgi:hypothetical protein
MTANPNSNNRNLKNVYLTIPVGQSVRDFLIMGTVDRLLDLLPDFRVVILSPSYNVPEFLELCPKHERAWVRRMELPVGGKNGRLIHWRLKMHKRLSLKCMIAMEERRHVLPPYLMSTFCELPPTLVVSTHPLLYHDYEVVMWARRQGIQTAGVVKSWDNIQKGLSSPCHLLSVWSPVNYDEAVNLLDYRPEELEINGTPSYDMYYHPAYGMAREEAMALMDLDPSRPVITLATVGVQDKEYYGRDETHLVDDLLRMIQGSDALKGAQLVIRLHSSSRLECFWKYMNRPGIRMSFSSFMPGMNWCPTRRDLIEQCNLLRYSDVIVTPGSSWVLEAAINDRPTVVPLYSDLQPEHAAAQLIRTVLARHYKPLADNNWVPITRSYQETKTAIEEAVTQPNKYATGRKAMVDNYVYYRDSNSSQRVAQWIAKIARESQPGKPRGF